MRPYLTPIVLLALAFARPAHAVPPRLVVVISIDQMRADYLDRFSELYEGGLKFLAERSVRFTNAHHNHALTLTAPGHLVLLTGRHPGPAGVPANDFYDPTQKRIVYCVEDTEAQLLTGAGKGVSFRRVQATGLGDWLKSVSPSSRVYSVAGKDRAAVLMGGRRPDGVYWYNASTGEFTTSTYYADTIPPFLQKFNARKFPDKYHDTSWDRLLPESVYLRLAGPDSQAGEEFSDEETAPVFPHHLGSASDRKFYGDFYQTPWLDEYTLEMAKALVLERNLGGDAHTDILSLSLSALDPVGHMHGPDSHEVMDVLMRLDRSLKSFLDFLEKEVSLKKTLIVLTSDHGVTPLVERLKKSRVPAERAGPQAKAFQKRVGDHIREKYGNPSKVFLFQGREVHYFNKPFLAEQKIPLKDILGDIRFLASSETWINRIYDREQLLAAKPLQPVGEKLRNSFHPDIGADLYILPQPYFYTSGYLRGTGHGTPYSDDSHVPLLIYDPAAQPALIADTVYTVGLAPTLAKRLGVPTPGDLPGAPYIYMERSP